MGIYDRDYIAKRPTSPALGGLRRFGPRTVSGWIIVICVAVFIFDEMLAPADWFKPVRVDVTVHIDRVDSEHLVESPPQRVSDRVFQIQILDRRDPSEPVAEATYMLMPPLKRWLHFSTSLGFLRVEFWRLIGFQFLHGHGMHLSMNMLVLFFLGPFVEQAMGAKRYLAFYLLCGICGALMYLTLNLLGFILSSIFGLDGVPFLLFNWPETPLVGASAGVFGILMAGAYIAPRTTLLLFFILPMRWKTLAYVLLCLSLVMLYFGAPNAGGEAAHIGGALAGMYFVRRPHHLHGFFDIIGRADPTSHHYRGDGSRRLSIQEEMALNRVLDKVRTSGMDSLTRAEQRILARATRRKGGDEAV